MRSLYNPHTVPRYDPANRASYIAQANKPCGVVSCQCKIIEKSVIGESFVFCLVGLDR